MNAPRSGVAQPVSVTIERLVLDGVALTPAQSREMQRSLELELARLMDGHRGDWQAAAVPLALSPALRLSEVPQPARVGRELAQCLCAAIGGTR